MSDVMLKGADEAIRELRRLADGALEEKTWNALEKGGKNVQAEARKRAPVFPGKAKRKNRKDVKPGALRDSIKLRKSRKKLEVKVEADYPFGKKDGRYYAFAAEYGTKNQAAQPFLKPAVNVLEEQIGRDLESAMEEAIR